MECPGHRPSCGPSSAEHAGAAASYLVCSYPINCFLIISCCVSLQVWLDGMGNASTIALTSSCARNLKAQGARSPAFASYGSVFQYVHSKEVREQDSRCRSIPGTWFIIAAHKCKEKYIDAHIILVLRNDSIICGYLPSCYNHAA